MSNTITFEFCAEDRARLDRLSNLLERLTARAKGRTSGGEKPDDEIQQKLTAVLATASNPAEAPKHATGEAEASAPSVAQPEEETATAEEPALQAETPEAPVQPDPVKEEKPTVTLAQIQQKVVQLAAGFGGSKKAKVREIVNTYAKKVSDLPEDKWTEVWDKLTALEEE